jgi:hypothetical protein
VGEKEIKPAGPTTPTGPVVTDGPAPGVTSGVASDGSSTMTKPGTGTGPEKPPPPPPPPPPDRPSSWSGDDLYPDGFRMGRDTDGTVYLNNPDGSTATWDGAQWNDPSGKPMPDSWSEGHRPTDYGSTR